MHIDTKEFELPETHYIRDIDSGVLQSLVLQCLSGVKGISLLDGTLLDALLGRGSEAAVRGVSVTQDPDLHSVSVKVEINVFYGIVMPQKAEEIQTLLTYEITRLTGLHVAAVHIVFKNMVSPDAVPKAIPKETVPEERYSSRFV
ncbi:MAG: Asp23/Gls24 family envelope stress response protein [Chlamydiota bacterium]